MNSHDQIDEQHIAQIPEIMFFGIISGLEVSNIFQIPMRIYNIFDPVNMEYSHTKKYVEQRKPMDWFHS